MSIVYDITATECVSSHTHFQWYNTLCMRRWYPLYILYHIQSIKHHVHILLHHTTLFMTSHAVYSWHHPHYSWNGIQCICVITTTPLMVSDQLYVWHHTHLTYAILCFWHHIPYACYHINCLWHYIPLCITSHQYIYDIISNRYAITILHSWKHNDYTSHLTQHIWHHSHCVCVITQMAHTSVSMNRSIDDISASV